MVFITSGTQGKMGSRRFSHGLPIPSAGCGHESPGSLLHPPSVRASTYGLHKTLPCSPQSWVSTIKKTLVFGINFLLFSTTSVIQKGGDRDGNLMSMVQNLHHFGSCFLCIYMHKPDISFLFFVVSLGVMFTLFCLLLECLL